MTATGKITAARIEQGMRIVVKVNDAGEALGASATKVKGAATVTVTEAPRRTESPGPRRPSQIELTTDRGTFRTNGGQTFWLGVVAAAKEQNGLTASAALNAKGKALVAEVAATRTAAVPAVATLTTGADREASGAVIPLLAGSKPVSARASVAAQRAAGERDAARSEARTAAPAASPVPVPLNVRITEYIGDSYTFGKPVAASTIAAMLGCDREYVVFTLARLVRVGIVVNEGAGLYRMHVVGAQTFVVK